MEAIYHHRRQRVFLILSGIFLGTLALLNVLGISRFLDMSFERVRHHHPGGGRRSACCLTR